MNQPTDSSIAGTGTRRTPVGRKRIGTPAPLRGSLVVSLRQRRAEIRVRWIELLLVEPVTSPLANPRTMMFMLDETLDQVFEYLERNEAPQAAEAWQCECGLNPYLAYFRAGIQAWHEALIRAQAEAGKITADERDGAFVRVDSIIRGIARRDIAAFAALCQHRHDDTKGDSAAPEEWDRALEFGANGVAERATPEHK